MKGKSAPRRRPGYGRAVVSLGPGLRVPAKYDFAGCPYAGEQAGFATPSPFVNPHPTR